MDARWDKLLTVLVCRGWHAGEIKDEVAYLAEELILIDVPNTSLVKMYSHWDAIYLYLPVEASSVRLGLIWNIGVDIHERDACEIVTTLDDRAV